MTMTPSDYATLYNSCRITEDPKKLKVLDYVATVALSHQEIYRAVEKGAMDAYGIAVPWPLIAAIHSRESDQNLKTHLHNGDPLTARTVHVPQGRPLEGVPPFEWGASALDALHDKWCPEKWDTASCLLFLERYNGTGYQKHGINTPYLWDYTDKYVSGLYVKDGVFDPLKVEDRPGCVAILKTLEGKGVSLDFSSLNLAGPTLH